MKYTEQKISDFKDIALEKFVLAGCLKYSDILTKCLEQIKPIYFHSSKCKWFYEFILDFHSKFDIVPNTESINIKLSERPADVKLKFNKFWDSIIKSKKKVKKAACYSAIERLFNLYRARTLESGLHSVVSGLKKAVEGEEIHIEKAIESFIGISAQLEQKSSNIKESDPIDKYLEFKKEHLKIQEDPAKFLGVPTGMEPLDARMKGLRPSELGLITAPPGRGKSILLLDFSYNCFISTGDVIYVTIEMPEKQIRQRFYCRLTGIPYNHFRDFTLNKDHFTLLDKKIKRFSKDHPNKFHILDFPQSCSINMMKNAIENHANKHNLPRLIVIDYMNIIAGGYDWQKQLDIAVGIKQKIARHFDVPVWTANQIAVAKSEKEHLSAADAAFAKNVIDNADVGISVGLTSESKDEEIYNIDFTKTRDFAAKGFKIQADKSRMTFSRTNTSKKVKDAGFSKEKIGGKIKV